MLGKGTKKRLLIYLLLSVFTSLSTAPPRAHPQGLGKGMELTVSASISSNHISHLRRIQVYYLLTPQKLANAIN
jgi:hypothetical protein